MCLILIGLNSRADDSVIKRLDLEKISDAIPMLEFTNSEHIKNLNSFDSKPLILHFWATWCESCKKELPQLMTIAQDMPGIQLIALSADEPTQIEQVKKFISIYKLEPNILTGNKDNKKFIAWGIPMTYFISGNRKIFLRARGAKDWSKISKQDFARLSKILE